MTLLMALLLAGPVLCTIGAATAYTVAHLAELREQGYEEWDGQD